MKRYINYIKESFKNGILFLQAMVAFVFYLLIKFLVPIKASSKFGYFIGYYLLGNLPLKRKKICISNIRLTFSNKTQTEALFIYKQSCGNFIQMVFELPHLDKIMLSDKYVTVVDKDTVLADTAIGKSCVVFLGHFANWEIAGFPFKDNSCYVSYKPPNNKFINWLFLKLRLQDNKNYKLTMLPFSRKIILRLNQEAKQPAFKIAMAIDQKLKEGVMVDFLGRPACSNQLLAIFALKYNLPVFSIRTIRHNHDVKFTIELDRLDLSDLEHTKAGILEATQRMNNKIANWVKSCPEQWFWLHKRW